jgi:hypothetical protein
VVELGLVNAQEEPAVNKDTAWLFQPVLTVRAAPAGSPGDETDGEAPADEAALAVFLPIDDPQDDLAGADADPEERHLRLLYRDQLRHAVGRNVAVRAEVRDGERRAHLLRTTWLPAFDVPATIAPPAGPGSPLERAVLSMDALASPETDLAAGLRPLAAGYRAWLDEQEAAIAALPAPLRPAAEAAVFAALQCADRIEAGIRLLTDPAVPGHEMALAAFRFANQAMALQRRHTAIGRLRGSEGLG